MVLLLFDYELKDKAKWATSELKDNDQCKNSGLQQMDKCIFSWDENKKTLIYILCWRHCLTLWRLHLKICWTLMSVFVWWCSDGPLNCQGFKSFEIYAVSIKISMIEYHQWINDLVDHLFFHSSLWGEMSMVFLVTCIMFAFLKHLMVLLRCNFVRASFLHLIKGTDSM